MPPISKEELIRWGESQQDGNCLAPAKYRFVEHHLEEVRKDYYYHTIGKPIPCRFK